MIEEMKRVRYTCDCCGAQAIEERAASEVNELPDGWEEYLHRLGTVRRQSCELAGCQHQCSQWAQ